MTRLLLIVAVALGTIPLNQDLFAQDRENVALRALPHVLTLRAYGSSGSELGLGSGFVLENGRIATNAHVVAGAAWIELFDSDGEYLGTAGYAEAVSTSLDLAILPAVEGITGGLTLATELPSVGESVWVIGSPQGLEGSVSTGVVSAIREADGRTYVQISAPISKGSSGGPVLSDAGTVVAVAVGLIPSGQNLNFGVAATDLARLASGPGGQFAFPTERSDEAPTAAVPSVGDLPDWVYLGRSQTGTDHYLQGRGSVSEGGIVWAWVRLVYPSLQTAGYIDEAFDEERDYKAFACARRLSAKLESTYHRDGQFIDSFGLVGEPRWHPVTPESYGETWLEIVCGERDISLYLGKEPEPR